MAGLGAHWARQTSLARLFHSQMRNITRVDNKKHSLHTLDKHNALRDSSKSLSRPLVGRRRPRNWGRDFRNHGEDVLFAAGGFTESSTYGPARQTFPTLTCALVGLEGSAGIASDSSGPFAEYFPS